VIYLQAELFNAPTQKKEATPNLRMVAYLEKEVSEKIYRCKVYHNCKVTNFVTAYEIYFFQSVVKHDCL